MNTFKPAFGLGNSHTQTIYSSLFRREKNISFSIKNFSLSDGDFLECYWHKTNTRQDNTPLVILFHGLAGSYKSPYIEGVVEELHKNGFDSVVMHFRGCTGVDNSLPRSYHSGDSGDALEFLRSLKEEFPDSKLYGVGYSLGANMLLKLLGEVQGDSLIDKAVAVSPPMRLDVCSNRMNRGFSRYYQHRLVKDLNRALDKKYDKHDMNSLLNLKRQDIKKLKTFWEFDGAYTAPIHGFESAQDYYTKSSSKQYLIDIQTPTLIIHSEDDPFMSKEVIPQESELSSAVELELTQKGGHVGFIGGTLFKPEYWLEKRICRYLLD
ncbi:MAG: hydrolase [Campylobacterota bacterium]|nr:hydrolase [Campylobacterota bacterium]